MPRRQCRARDTQTRLRCDRDVDHDGEHRAEPGPTPIATESNRTAPMVTWTTDYR